ncbi:hypothetical protein [Sporosarcina sp. FSL K6-5500]|uniref:hypothetical protein n=1 Tax=Sporosarcina sp. FSL K6-5500 TaxID=2921558 RepID=UPI0030F90E1B
MTKFNPNRRPNNTDNEEPYNTNRRMSNSERLMSARQTNAEGSYRPARRKNDATAQAKTRKRKNRTGILEHVFLPLRVSGCKEGSTTSRGTNTIQFDLQHIETGATFTTLVFEDIAPDYIEDKIIYSILPDDDQDFNLEDLIDHGFLGKLRFNERNNVTYMNIIDAMPLDDHYEELLQQTLRKEQQAKRATQQNIRSVEDEMEDFLDLTYDPPSRNPRRKAVEPSDEEKILDEDLDLTEKDLEIDEDLNLIDEESDRFYEDLGLDEDED